MIDTGLTHTPLTREAILAAQDIVTETVDVPEWGGSVLVRGLSGFEREAFEKAQSREKPAANRAGRRAGQTVTEVIRDNIRARIVAWCVVDEAGARVFADEDIPALNRKSGAALERVVEVGMRLSGMTEEDVDELAEEMEANPTSAPSSNSPSD